MWRVISRRHCAVLHSADYGTICGSAASGTKELSTSFLGEKPPRKKGKRNVEILNTVEKYTKTGFFLVILVLFTSFDKCENDNDGRAKTESVKCLRLLLDNGCLLEPQTRDRGREENKQAKQSACRETYTGMSDNRISEHQCTARSTKRLAADKKTSLRCVFDEVRRRNYMPRYVGDSLVVL